jgi:sugar lactone lactonase YvrE
MDGTSRTVLHSTGLVNVYGMTLDYDGQVLYWIDYSNNRIERSFTNGSNRMLITSTGIVDPFAMTFYDGRLYWTDLSHHRIYTLNLTTPTIITQVISIGQDGYGIHVVTEERQLEGISYRDHTLEFRVKACVHCRDSLACVSN